MNRNIIKKLVAAALFAVATPAAAQVVVPLIPHNVPIIPPIWLPGAQVPYRPNPIRIPLPTGPVITPAQTAIPSAAALPTLVRPAQAAVALPTSALPAAIELPSPLRAAREKGLPIDAQLLTQVFDGVKTEAVSRNSVVDPSDNPELERAPEPQYGMNERQVTVPEWELEQDLGIR